jgi:hypothetical protein
MDSGLAASRRSEMTTKKLLEARFTPSSRLHPQSHTAPAAPPTAADHAEEFYDLAAHRVSPIKGNEGQPNDHPEPSLGSS